MYPLVSTFFLEVKRDFLYFFIRFNQIPYCSGDYIDFTMKKNPIIEFLYSAWYVLLFVLAFASLGSAIICFVGLFLFLIPDKNKRLNLFLGLIFVNILINIVLIFNPLDFQWIDSLNLWYTRQDPEVIEWVYEGYGTALTPEDITNFPEFLYHDGILGLSLLSSAYLYSKGILDSFSIGIVWDIIGFFGYFQLIIWLGGNED